MQIEFVTKGPVTPMILSLLSDLRDQILRCITYNNIHSLKLIDFVSGQ